MERNNITKTEQESYDFYDALECIQLYARALIEAWQTKNTGQSITTEQEHAEHIRQHVMDKYPEDTLYQHICHGNFAQLLNQHLITADICHAQDFLRCIASLQDQRKYAEANVMIGVFFEALPNFLAFEAEYLEQHGFVPYTDDGESMLEDQLINLGNTGLAPQFVAGLQATCMAHQQLLATAQDEETCATIAHNYRTSEQTMTHLFRACQNVIHDEIFDAPKGQFAPEYLEQISHNIDRVITLSADVHIHNEQILETLQRKHEIHEQTAMTEKKTPFILVYRAIPGTNFCVN